MSKLDVFEWYDGLGNLIGIGCRGHVLRETLIFKHDADDMRIGLAQHLWGRWTLDETGGHIEPVAFGRAFAITVAEFVPVGEAERE